MKIFIHMFLCLALAGDDTWQCQKAKDQDHTNWEGVHEIDNFDGETSQVKGIVTRGECPLSDVLVEIYDHPEKTLIPHPDLKLVDIGRRRLAACYTNTNGKFCFHNTPPGEYEIRFSKPSFNTHSLVGVRIVKKTKTPVEIIKIDLYHSF